jgi:hypothetical protein
MACTKPLILLSPVISFTSQDCQPLKTGSSGLTFSALRQPLSIASFSKDEAAL